MNFKQYYEENTKTVWIVVGVVVFLGIASLVWGN